MQLRLSHDFRIDTALLQLQFERGVADVGQLRRRGRCITVILPRDFDFANPVAHQWAHRVLCGVLRAEAKRILPAKVSTFARQYGLRYNRVVIKDVSTRWGSCSSLGNINLSLWLLLVPEDLVDYVVKHELAHLNEMNHGPRFWAEVDHMTGGPGTGKALERRMKTFSRTLARVQ